uniref:Uncharacterized protein n=1 Tax=Arion vulgaris TaxID=1028688 RepID=A0A0B7B3M8_9EUPU
MTLQIHQLDVQTQRKMSNYQAISKIHTNKYKRVPSNTTCEQKELNACYELRCELPIR